MNSIILLKSKIIDREQFQDKKSLTKFLLMQGNLITFINPYSYLTMRRNIELYNRFHFILSDGILLTRLLYLLNIVKTRRFSFDMTSLAETVFNYSCKMGLKLYLIGGTKKEINLAISNILAKYSNISIVGSRNGFFTDLSEREKEIDKIKIINPDIVIAGLGAGLQEDFLVGLKEIGWNGIGITCGGFIKQISSDLNYYPKLLNKLNLRWIFRIYKEPKLVYRYVFLYPKAIYYFVVDSLKLKFH